MEHFAHLDGIGDAITESPYRIYVFTIFSGMSILTIIYSFHNGNAAALPLAVTMGIPALHSTLISRLMVRRENSYFSASSGAVTFSFCKRIDRIPYPHPSM